MKDILMRRTRVLLFVSLGIATLAWGQGYDSPLTMQGINNNILQSPSSRALGGTSLVAKSDFGLMFRNPAAMSMSDRVQISIGGVQQFNTVSQTQQYAPLKYYSNFSLLMEGLTGSIPNPDTSIVGVNPGDTVQRPYDTIGPNWSNKHNYGLPGHVLISVPVTINDMTLMAGGGMIEYADLNSFYQNNNVLSPSILSERPVPLSRPPNDSVPIITQWYQFSRSREGSIRGYGISLAGTLPGSDFSFGLGGMLLRGSSDDFEKRIARGRMTFYTNYFRLDSVYRHSVKSGTSDYSGLEFVLSSVYKSRDVRFGFSIKPPTTITRDFNSVVQLDSSGGSSTLTEQGSDKLRLPWRGQVGLGIAVRENLTIGLEYEIKPYSSAVYTSPSGAESDPWLSVSAFHAGAEYVPVAWLAVRAGLHEQAEVFETEGNPIEGDPVRTTVYSAGLGISSAGFSFNVAYEYSLLKYQDIWGGAISLNDASVYRIFADFSFEIPGF